MGTIFAIVGSNLTVSLTLKLKYFLCYHKVILETLLIILSGTTLDFLKAFSIHKLINALDSNLKFIFEELASYINHLDINTKVADSHLHFDIYHKPFNHFSCLKYNSCHLSHTKHCIPLLLVRRIMRLVIDNQDFRL